MTCAILIGHIIEFSIVFLFYNIVFQRKRKLLTTACVGGLLYFAVFLVYIIFDSSILNIVTETVYFFVFCKLFYKSRTQINILYSLLLTIALSVSEFLVMALASVGNHDINAYKTSTDNFILINLFSKTIFFVIVLLLGTLSHKTDIKKVPVFLILFPIASTIILYALWFFSSENGSNEKVDFLIVLASISIIISVLLTYIFYFKSCKELNELYRLRQEHSKESTDVEYYSVLDSQNIQMKTMLHNEKNHLSAIKSLANSPIVNEYIDNLYGEIVAVSLFGNTKNKTLDLIINKYKHICAEENINFDVKIFASNLSHIESTDLTTLFGNLLDNAVEAAKNSREKTISLSLSKINGFDILTCKNSCDYSPLHIADKLITTKKDTKLHGFGVLSIKNVVKKYKGTYEWAFDKDNREFIVNIIFCQKK